MQRLHKDPFSVMPEFWCLAPPPGWGHSSGAPICHRGGPRNLKKREHRVIGMRSGVCVCMYVRMYVCMYVCMHACMHACMHVYVYMHVRVHTHTQTDRCRLGCPYRESICMILAPRVRCRMSPKRASGSCGKHVRYRA